jgi:hypothetical protein
MSSGEFFVAAGHRSTDGIDDDDVWGKSVSSRQRDSILEPIDIIRLGEAENIYRHRNHGKGYI